jgi:hypothetical protein
VHPLSGVISGGLIVFEPMAANVPAPLKPIDIECMVYAGIDRQIEPGAVAVRPGCHLAAGFSRVRIIDLADKDQSRRNQSCGVAAALAASARRLTTLAPLRLACATGEQRTSRWETSA